MDPLLENEANRALFTKDRHSKNDKPYSHTIDFKKDDFSYSIGHIPPTDNGLASFSFVRRGKESYDVFSFSRSRDIGNFTTYMQGIPTPERVDKSYKGHEATQKARELLDSLRPFTN